jgi:hypothetical protein
MIHRLMKVIKSLTSGKRVEETVVSTSIDDTREGKRTTFSERNTNELLRKCGLLDEPEEPSANPMKDSAPSKD